MVVVQYQQYYRSIRRTESKKISSAFFGPSSSLISAGSFFFLFYLWLGGLPLFILIHFVLNTTFYGYYLSSKHTTMLYFERNVCMNSLK